MFLNSAIVGPGKERVLWLLYVAASPFVYLLIIFYFDHLLSHLAVLG